jgi:hypothetical protein
MQHLYETESDRSSLDDISIAKSKVSELRNIYISKSKEQKMEDNVSTSTYSKEDHTCNICNDKCGPFIILSCNHIFHIKCLAEVNFTDIYKYPVIDTEYFESRHCTVCNETMQTEDLMYLHSKFLSSTKKLITKHQTSIEHLENQLRQIKVELRTCYDYKHKLEQEREKSKQIVSVLTTMM